MKKTFLWFGLAIPAVLGGAAAIFKTQKSNGAGNTGNNPVSDFKNKSRERISSSEESIKKESHSSSNEMLSEKPDLDKDLNIEKTSGSAEKRPIKRNLKNLKKPDKSSVSKDNGNKKIYTGAKGGKYYLNANGSKVYLKK
jgi:colicin import membrane protein